MFIVQLQFRGDRSRARPLMEGHNRWIARGFDDGVFLVVGGLQPDRGGAIVAHDTSRDELERRVAEDPFVAEGLVDVLIDEITPARTDERLRFLQPRASTP